MIVSSVGGRGLVVASAQVPVQVGNSDVENLVIALGAAVSVPVRLTIADSDSRQQSAADRLRVQLTPSFRGAFISYVQAPPPAQMTPAGTLQIPNVLPGEYRVQVAGLQPDFYVKEARLGAKDALNQPLDFSQPIPGTLDVVVSARVGRIDGIVTDEALRPQPGIQVVLIPNQHRDRPDLFRNVTTDQSGRFQIPGVAPGDYRVFAWETIEQFAYYDLEFIRRNEQRGQPVKVSESLGQNVQVRIIPAER